MASPELGSSLEHEDRHCEAHRLPGVGGFCDAESISEFPSSLRRMSCSLRLNLVIY